jgi:hypothetical protein
MVLGADKEYLDRLLLRIQYGASDEDPSNEDSDESYGHVPLNNLGVTSVFTTDELMNSGLTLAHFTSRRIKRAKNKRNVIRFKSHYGIEPRTSVVIW